jgi:AcrR family transcriptional regulator
MAENSSGAEGGRQAAKRSARPMLPRAVVEGHRRRRILTSLTEVAHEEGCAEVPAAKIIDQAQMSRNAFYDLFDSKAECLQFCFEEAFQLLFEPVQAASESTDPWVERVRAGLEVLFARIAAKPLLAELSLVHSRGLGDVTLAAGHNYEAAVTTMINLLAGGRDAGGEVLGDEYQDPPPAAEEFLSQAILSLAVLRIKQGQVKALRSQRDEMMILVSTPFFGLDGALRASRWAVLDSNQ